MKRELLISLTCLGLCIINARTETKPVQPEFFDVFTSGKEGYASIRIPAVIVSQKGTVLAAAEGRKKPTDQAENDIILKRSEDGGATWSPLAVLHDDGANSLNNPTLVQETKSGRIFLWYQRIPAHLKEHSKETATGLEGENIYRNLILTSDDDGKTWSAPQDVTATTKRPQRATTIASGPGIGIQLTRGPHKGRLIIPFNEGPFWKWQNYAVVSDDGGANWKFGGDVPGALLPDDKHGERSLINEVQMVELTDGSVRLDSRQFNGQKVRKSAVSRDGGLTWGPVEELPDLTDPSCMAGILRYSFDDATERGRLLHTGPDSEKRERGTVWMSVDDGATWPVKRILWPGAFAYSVPTKLADGRVGVLFEADDYKRIVFARFPVEWISEGANFAALPEARWETTGKFGWWMERHNQKLEETKKGGMRLVFVGDSITHNWEKAGAAAWKKHFAPRHAANYGFSGDSTQHVLWRIKHDEFDGMEPAVIVLNIGTNNLRHGNFTVEEIATGVRAVAAALEEKCPRAKLVVLGIFPRGATQEDPLRKKAAEVNALLAKSTWGAQTEFLDIGASFLAADGSLTKEVAPDFLHLSAAGYAKWAEALEPVLKRLGL